MDPLELAVQLREARDRTFELIADLSDAQLMVPRAEILNPFEWEAGHVAFFLERFILRDLDGVPSLRADADALFDSAAIAHDTRWDLPLPGRAAVATYLADTRDAVLRRMRERGLDEGARYRCLLCLFHEDMHAEAFTYMRQTVGYPAPRLAVARAPARKAGPHPGDAHVAGGRFALGAARGGGFVFDNEQWAHDIELAPFGIARACVTQAEFAAFVDDGGYRRRELWSEDGWAWREAEQALHPVYWRRLGDHWQRRHFDNWRDLEPHRPVIHVNWYEAEAWCRWAWRRLPTEAEWEAAACGGPAAPKTRFPWGDQPITTERANLDWSRMDTLDVGALPQGDSPVGCRQMTGNVWQWTASPFAPYPGFAPGPYKEYSQPWFHVRKVLRGGAWMTRGRMLRNTWRNFFQPWRRDVPAGFRTCAI
jgi:gamma-glutamyl hercynylcysteine S-oxide synthase